MTPCKSIALSCFTLLFVLTGTVSLPAHGQMVIEKKFFRPLSFKLDDSKPQRVYNFSGFGLHRTFQDVLAHDEDALAAAQKALAFNKLAIGGAVLVFAGGVLILVDAASSISLSPLGNNNNSFNSSSSGPFIVTSAGVLVLLVGSLTSLKHLRTSATIYNANNATTVLDQHKHGIRLTFDATSIDGYLGAGLTLAW